MMYAQERVALPYFYGKRKVLADGLSKALWKCKRTRPPDDYSFTHMDPRWKRPFTCIVAGPTGCGKTTFVAQLLRNAFTVIDPSPERVTWYDDLDIPNLHLEERLPTSFDAGKRNIVVLDDLTAETDERVTNLFTKKATTVIHPSYISCKTCFQKKRGESNH